MFRTVVESSIERAISIPRLHVIEKEEKQSRDKGAYLSLKKIAVQNVAPLNRFETYEIIPFLVGKKKKKEEEFVEITKREIRVYVLD